MRVFFRQRRPSFPHRLTGYLKLAFIFLKSDFGLNYFRDAFFESRSPERAALIAFMSVIHGSQELRTCDNSSTFIQLCNQTGASILLKKIDKI